MAYRTNLTNLPENRYFGIGLYNPKNSFNVGNSIRATGAFNGKFCIVSGNRHKEKGDYRHADTEAASLRIPCLMGVENLQTYLPENCVPIAIELSDRAENLIEFEHPAQAYYIFGPEDNTLPPEILDWCKKTIYIPTECSLNLATAVNIVLYDRKAKEAKLKDNSIHCPNCQHVHWRKHAGKRQCNACGHEFEIL